MTSGETPTGSSATKLGGYALIGVGALAAVFGVATLFTGGGQDSAAPPPGDVGNSPSSSVVTEQPQQPPQEQSPGQNESEKPSEPAGSPDPAEPPSDGQAGERPGSAPQPPAPGRPHASPQNSPDKPDGISKPVVRVYNNSTIKGLAHRAADDFRGAGYEVPEIGNYSDGRIYTTTVYFRPDTREEATAREIGKHFRARVEPRFGGIEDASAGLIVIVTNDYQGAPASK
ncbi:LytR C-terminal domain-containing protein [Parasphingorhabdus pacifica]